MVWLPTVRRWTPCCIVKDKSRLVTVTSRIRGGLYQVERRPAFIDPPRHVQRRDAPPLGRRYHGPQNAAKLEKREKLPRRGASRSRAGVLGVRLLLRRVWGDGDTPGRPGVATARGAVAAAAPRGSGEPGVCCCVCVCVCVWCVFVRVVVLCRSPMRALRFASQRSRPLDALEAILLRAAARRK